MSDWWDLALCQAYDTEYFYPPDGTEAPGPKAVCAKCPVTDECLAYALKHKEPDGVWGGYTALERRRILRKQRSWHAP